MRKFCLLTVLFIVQTQAGNATTQQQLDQATSVVEQFCLSGKSISIKADINGNVSLIRLSPGAQGKIEADVKKSSGGVGYLNEEIRKTFDKETRDCMSPYINKIIDMIKESGKVKEEKFAALGPQVNFGCERGATSSISYEPPPGYKILNAYVEPVNTSNTKEIHPSVEKTDKKAIAKIYFHGKDREFYNCPGGGHGQVRIHGTIISE